MTLGPSALTIYRRVRKGPYPSTADIDEAAAKIEAWDGENVEVLRPLVIDVVVMFRRLLHGRDWNPLFEVCIDPRLHSATINLDRIPVPEEYAERFKVLRDAGYPVWVCDRWGYLLCGEEKNSCTHISIFESMHRSRLEDGDEEEEEDQGFKCCMFEASEEDEILSRAVDEYLENHLKDSVEVTNRCP